MFKESHTFVIVFWLFANEDACLARLREKDVIIVDEIDTVDSQHILAITPQVALTPHAFSIYYMLLFKAVLGIG